MSKRVLLWICTAVLVPCVELEAQEAVGVQPSAYATPPSASTATNARAASSTPARDATPAAAPFRSGVRVRLKSNVMPWHPITGTVTYLGQDSIVVDTADTWATQRFLNPSFPIVDEFRKVTLPTRSITRAEVSLGRDRKMGVLTSVVRGALIGGLVMGLGNMSGKPNPTLKMFAQGAASGSVAGAAIGIPVGWFLVRAEQWRAVPVPRAGRSPVAVTAKRAEKERATGGQ